MAFGFLKGIAASGQKYDGRFAVDLANFVASIPEARQAFPQLAEEAKAIASMQNMEEREVFAAEQYRKMENFLVANMSQKYSVAVLREMVRRKMRPELVGEGAALLFLPADMRAIALFRIFNNTFAFRVFQSVGQENFIGLLKRRFTAQKLAGPYIEKAAISWKELNDLIADIPSGEQFRYCQDSFSHLTGFLMTIMKERIQEARTQILIEDIYRDIKTKYRFLDDTAIVLATVPDQNILKDERVGMLSKTELTEHARMQTKKIEETLAELQHEKDRLTQALKELEESQAKLKALDYAKGQFIDVVSHQFRTPLSTIRWSAENLHERYGGKMDDDSGRFLDNIRMKTIFIVNILNDMFDVLAVEGADLRLQKKPTQVWELVDDQIKVMEVEAAPRGVKLMFEKSEAAIKEALVDQDTIKRVLEILLRNAINYSPQNAQVYVTMGQQMKDGKNYLWVEIKDTGIGIAPEDLPKIFTKFFRAQNAIRTVADGAGLGLYLVHNIIVLHGGAVEVFSELGKGSVFRFYIPLEA